jgi:3',5'-cyclic-AMP phosphodiesterase
MKILNINKAPSITFPYYQAGTSRDNWGNQSVLKYDLPIILAQIDDLPEGLDALILTSDLQGLVVNGEHKQLVGEALPEFLSLFLSLELQLDPQKTGVILAGDFFATLDSRGGLGDVRLVWRTFRDHFRWVVGVGGNHDDFGQNMNELPSFRREKGVYYLENEEITVDNLHFGGLSGIIGENNKHLRIPEVTFAKHFQKRINNRPDLLLSHQNPWHKSTPHKGGQCLLKALSSAPGQLLVCGHAIWEEPFFELKNGAQVLNVGERVFVLMKK